MFGTIIYGTTPYATTTVEDGDKGEFNPWVEQCKSEDEWEKEKVNTVGIRRCNDAT